MRLLSNCTPAQSAQDLDQNAAKCSPQTMGDALRTDVLRWGRVDRSVATAVGGRGHKGSRWLPPSGCTVWGTAVGQVAAVRGIAVIGPPRPHWRRATDRSILPGLAVPTLSRRIGPRSPIIRERGYISLTKRCATDPSVGEYPWAHIRLCTAQAGNFGQLKHSFFQRDQSSSPGVDPGSKGRGSWRYRQSPHCASPKGRLIDYCGSEKISL